MRILLPALAFTVLLVGASCVRAPAQLAQEQPRDALYHGMVGKWVGSRVVADSSPAAGRVVQAALVVVPAPARDGLELRYRLRGDTVAVEPALGLWHFARGLDAARLNDVDGPEARQFRVVEQVGGRNGAPLQLVLEADGEAEARPARIRQQIDVSAGILRIRRDVQVGDGEFAFQEAFVFRRAE